MTAEKTGIDAPPKKAALVFPGVGVRLIGREPVFYSIHRPQLKPLFEEASDACDENLEARLLDGRIDELSDAKRQFFTYAFSAGVAEVTLGELTPEAAAGYSFGIYAALYAARVFSFREGLRVLDNACKIMKRASNRKNLGMGIVVGLNKDELQSIIANERLATVVQTNTNHELCHVFSGSAEDIAVFLSCAEKAGAFKFERLEVDIPYHHPVLLASAPADLRKTFEGESWSNAQFPLVSTIDGGLLKEPEPIRGFIAKHLATPISWQRAVQTLSDLGVTEMHECGPGISLTQNGRFLPFEMTYHNVKKAMRSVDVKEGRTRYFPS
jgi:[acyl-carrier-protein] S-malonyltransferase